MSIHTYLQSLKSKKDVIVQFKLFCEKPWFNFRAGSFAGNDVLDYYFLQERLHTKTRRHISFIDAMNDPKLSKFLLQKGRQFAKKKGTRLSESEKIHFQYQAFRFWFGTVNQFRPVIARALYAIIQPKIGILDPSAGWGGRMLGAICENIPYIGFDTNTNLRKPYKQIIRDLHMKNSKLYFKPSETVDFSKFQYDLIFTSPPYFFIERYSKMPNYVDKENFTKTYFRPMIEHVWSAMKNGILALNMPDEMCQMIESLIGPPQACLPIPLRNRHLQKQKASTECIFLWTKGKTQSIDTIVQKWTEWYHKK